MADKNNINENNLQPLKWRIDIDAYRKLGRELITDRTTAIYELVKNCYDANAENVYIEFNDVINPDGEIIIKDDGFGMTYQDFHNKWMVISTGSKRIEEKTPPPYNRIYIGEKGIGRFAVDKIASKVIIKSKKINTKVWNCFEIDWDVYDKIIKSNGYVKKILLKNYDTASLLKNEIIFTVKSKPYYFWASNIDTVQLLIEQLTLLKFSKKIINKIKDIWLKTRNVYLTDIEHKVWNEPGELKEHGTSLILHPLRDIWTEHDIKNLYWELSKIVPPFSEIQPPFKIYLNSNEHESIKKLKVQNRAVDYATLEYNINFGKDYQEELKFEKTVIAIKKVPIKNYGPIKMRLYYFDQYGKANFRKHIKNYQIDGIKIYRDGIITTPFAESEKDRTKQRDILGIDKRRWSGFFEKVSSQDLIGIINITKASNSKIKDATNRQNFEDCLEYREFKDFIIAQLAELEKYLKYKKKIKWEKTDKDIKLAEYNLYNLIKIVDEIIIKASSNEIKAKLKKTKKIISSSANKLKSGIKKQEALKQELDRKEKLYQGIISLHEYSKNIAHALNIEISNIKDRAEYMASKIEKYYTTKKNIFIQYAKEIYSEMEKVAKVLEFILEFSKVHLHPQEFNLSNIIKDVIEVNEYNFQIDNIKVDLNLDDSIIIEANPSAFKIIFENLVSNSRKSLRNISKKKERLIKISLYKEKDNIIIIFSDNGIGISEDIQNKIFEIYYTTTAEHDGAGIGLYVVRNYLNLYKGDIKIIDKEFVSEGVSFKITLPVEKEV